MPSITVLCEGMFFLKLYMLSDMSGQVGTGQVYNFKRTVHNVELSTLSFSFYLQNLMHN